MQKKQVNLKNPVKPLYISYPPFYQGLKSGDREDRSFCLTTTPKMLNLDEIELAKEAIDKLPYEQSLVFTGFTLVGESNLPSSNAGLDIYEKERGLSSSAKSGTGGRNTIRQRQIAIAEKESQANN